MSGKSCTISTCINSTSEKFINCSGPCNKVVHAVCVGINNSAFPLFATKNIKWFCDDCSVILDKLSHQMSVMLNMLQSLSNDVNTFIASNQGTERRITRQSNKKKQITDDDVISTPPKVVTQIVDNIEANTSNIIIGSCVEDSLKSVPVRKYIHASRFLNSTTTDAVKKYLNNKLQLPEEEIDCRLLVAANQDVSKFNFISFKIGINPASFDKLLHPDVWPMGVLIREFVDRPKNVNAVVLS